MLFRLFTAAVCCAAVGVSQAQAHFLWLDVKPAAAAQGPKALVYFGEEAAPGEAHLIGKVAHTKLWARDAAGAVTELKIAPAEKDLAALVADCPASPAVSLEATCDYGVYERGPGVLLQYYARHLAGDWARSPSLARAERLKLDIVPSLDGKQLRLTVLYQNQPVAGGEVVIVDPAGEVHELATDDKGRVDIVASAGRFAIRAAHKEPKRSGERDGKSYGQTWHYATLTLDVPAAGVATAEPTARELLTRARAGRAMWDDAFPGFTAELAVYGGGEELAGKATIDAGGGVSLELPKSKLAEWVEQQLQSLVQHRMPDGEVGEGNITYPDADRAHPLGRLIDLGDPSLESRYRIKDDVILEVNRSMGSQRFTISVLEIIRNAENKYLPRSFTMSFFDSATGALAMSLAYRNDWQRVGDYDLPQMILEINSRPGGASTRQIVFKNCRLLEK